MYVLILTALFVAIPALAQESIPFKTTRDKKLLANVKIDGKERTLVLDTGAVDLILDVSAVGMKLSDLKEGSCQTSEVEKLWRRSKSDKPR